MKDYVVTFNGIECGSDVYEPVVIKPRKTVMKGYNFSLIGFYSEPLDEDTFLQLSNDIYEVGCDDATVSQKGDILVIDFHRKAVSYAEAVSSATISLNQIEGLTVKMK